MATVDSIRIKNLRSLTDTGWIEQKLITLLVGKNSAGKSTFARVFPLLRQSAAERKQSPILWFGQYVDFGQFSSAVYNKTPNSPISFGFKLTISPMELERRNPYTRNRALRETEKDPTLCVEAEIFLTKGGDKNSSDTIADKLTLRILDFLVVIKFSKNSEIESLTIDQQELWKSKPGFFSHVAFDSTLPSFRFYKERKETIEKEGGKVNEIYLEEHDPFKDILINKIRQHVHGNLGDDKVQQIASRLIFADKEQFINRAIAAGVTQRIWTDHLLLAKDNPTILRSLQYSVLCDRFTELLRIINYTLSSHFGAVRYVEPLRATAQRYYRKQDLAIGELDAKGTNVAQFLQSLPAFRRQSFDEICKRLFGFTVKPRVEGGHIELLLEQLGTGTSVNIADAGVGFSQLLPILLQLWDSDASLSKQNLRIIKTISATLVIEQPELHLHPAYQAILADLFCETVARKEKEKNRIFAETHSAALVNRLGALVAGGKINPNDVQILLFEQIFNEGATDVKVATFDEDGVLSNWPFGFFEPEI